MQDKIQEIMTLIDGYAASDSINLRMLIESKLRELVREPLSDEQRLLMWQHVSLRGVAKPSYDAWFQAGVSAAERAHGITNASGEHNNRASQLLNAFNGSTIEASGKL